MPFSIIREFYSRPVDPVSEIVRKGIREALPLFTPKTGGLFLDIGCNNGVKSVEFGRFIDARLTLGIDFECLALRESKARGIFAVAVDLNQGASLPFPSSFFDCIHAGEVMEHLFSPDYLLKEIHRLLKPDGYAVISTPNLASWRNRLALLAGWQPFFSEVSTAVHVGNPRKTPGNMSGHIRLFTPGALVQLVEHYGLPVQRMTGWATGRPTSPATYGFAAVDWVMEKFCPRLCDDLVIKVTRADAIDSEPVNFHGIEK
jgi:SAM-dependent methyltransferase